MINHPKRARWVKLSALALVASAAAACSDVSVTDPSALPMFALTPPTPVQEQGQLCVDGPAGTYTFSLSESDLSNVMTLNAGTSVNVSGGSCVLIATTAGGGFFDTARVSVTWTGVPTGVALDSVINIQYMFPNKTATTPSATNLLIESGPTSSSKLGIERATVLIFNFTATPTLEGCSPGYWKNHTSAWPTYATSALFSSVFEDAFPGMTLLQVLKQGGGGLNALGRHIVAALLSSAAGLDTGYTPQEVINAFNAAYPSSSYSAIVGTFETISDATCTLN